MKLIPARALRIPILVLLLPLPVWAASAVDEALAEAARTGRDATAQSVRLPSGELPAVAAPPPAARSSYGQTLAEPGALEKALRSFADRSRSQRTLPTGAGSVLAGSGAADEFLLETPALRRESGPQGVLLPAGLPSQLGLPAPMDVAPR